MKLICKTLIFPEIGRKRLHRSILLQKSSDYSFFQNHA